MNLHRLIKSVSILTVIGLMIVSTALQPADAQANDAPQYSPWYVSREPQTLPSGGQYCILVGNVSDRDAVFFAFFEDMNNVAVGLHTLPATWGNTHASISIGAESWSVTARNNNGTLEDRWSEYAFWELTRRLATSSEPLLITFHDHTHPEWRIPLVRMPEMIAALRNCLEQRAAASR